MDIVIPEILAGGVGRSIQAQAGSIAKIGATVSKIQGEVENNYKKYEGQRDLIEASRIENDMVLSKMKAINVLSRDDDGTDEKFIDRVREQDERIGQEYISKGTNEPVKNYLTKVHLHTQNNNLVTAQDGREKRLWNTSVENLKIQTDNVIRRSAQFADFDGGISAIDEYINTSGVYFGAETAPLAGRMKARFAENLVRINLQDPATAPVMLRKLSDKDEKQKIMAYIPADKLDDMEKLITSAKEKAAGANAFLTTLAEAEQMPEVQSGKMGKMDAALQIWMRPETIKKYNLTDKTWREGMLNFKASLDFRDAQDEKNAGESTIKLSEKFTNHQLRYDNIEKTFSGIVNPALKAKYVEHWTKLIDSQSSQLRAEETARRGVSAAERSAKASELANNPFNVDVPEVKARLLQKSIDTPFAPGLANEINLALGNGISSNTYKAIMGNLSTKSVWKTPAGRELYRQMNVDKRDKEFSSKDVENVKVYGDMLENYKDYLEKYPNAAPKDVLNDYEAKKKVLKKGAIRKFIEEKYDQVTQ